MAAGHWPADMIDGEHLYELMGLTSADPDQIGQEAYGHLLDFETAVDDAHLKGRVKRFTAKDPTSGDVVAHGYKRSEALAILRSMAKSPAPAATPPSTT